MADILFTNVRIFDGGGEAPFTGEVLVQGNRIARVVRSGHGERCRAGRRRAGRRRRRRVPDAGDGRGAHALLVERPADARRDPAHAARGAHPVVRRGGEALSRHGLDELRRRRGGEAAPRRRHPQRHQRRHDRRPALPGGEPGDHGARRPRRHDRSRTCRSPSSRSARSSAAPRRCAAASACSPSTASTR